MTTTLTPPPSTASRADDGDTRTVPPSSPPPHRGRAARLVRGGADDPRWARPALLILLALTAVLYLWNLSASGYANSFYAAAAQSGSQSWKAWFFGSLDSSNSITVDKPPASLWVMGLSARIFGFNSWSLLVPQALEGVAAVGLLYGAVRRVAGHGAGLLAGAVLALTPAAVLMFRFDNPDALLTLLLVAAAYALTRALEAASGRWLALCGSALGFAFLTKMLQGLLVLPVFALVYLIAAPTSLRRRIGQTLLAGLSLVVSAGWWLVVVALWPAGSRPYIGGSTDNTVLDLVFGYNGFGRLFGSEGNGGGGGGGGTAGSSFGGATGLTRLFGSEMGNEISWLLPAALVALVAGLVLTGRAPRTDRTRAALLGWGGWLIVTGLIFSYMKGTIHPYYTVALAPAIAALVAIGGATLWRARATVAGRLGLVAVVAAAGAWSWVLLGRVSDWHPELRWAVLVATVLAAAGLLVPRLGRAARGVVVAALAAGLIGTASFGLATAASAHNGSIPTVGPTAAQSSGMGGGTGGSGNGGPGGSTGGQAPSGSKPSGSKPSGSKPSGSKPSGSRPSATSTSSSGTRSMSVSGAATRGGSGGGTTSSTALTTALRATTTTWAAATVGDQSAAELILSSGKAVIAIGGWSGSDNSPTLAQFKAYVAAGKITYFVAGTGQGGGQSGVASQITAWVKAHYTATTVGGQTVYKLV
ncbi:4-amino-4-deoxy-L-arabinose transferase [Jatrophihabitans endophyticus]|uniref:4-amino-4-deoxy-L-arabinose transferase n=1 Tax=Jatrophihabitans endophyticus TaxID=1206085 RepID=A0A1M5T6L2_9ACTN|nr:glycosyltransferase family 39 protein [Jatrophihabitans endophyticus]SHH46346.1 4-amino-4-deoxy-L-arabinose transferase [Jatrophihabitans endophyticus]